MLPPISNPNYRLLTANDINTQIYILEKSIEDINGLPEKARESQHFISELNDYQAELKALDAIPDDYTQN